MTNRIIYRQQGFSLVELMVGMVLGLFLAMGIAQVFISNNSSFRTQEGLAKIQEGGRFAMGRISSAIRMAGYFGCSGPAAGDNSARTNVLAVGLTGTVMENLRDPPVSGVNNVAAGTDIDGNTLVEGSDTITLFGSGMSGQSFTGVDVPPESDITINTPHVTFKEGDYVMIADCQTIDVLRATNNTDPTTVKHAITSDGATFNKKATLSRQYGEDAVVTHPYINTYFVADSGRTNFQGRAIMSLFMQDINGLVSELVEGVSDLQVLYGVDTDTDYESDRYMTATEIGASGSVGWGDVVSVRISLLVDSIDDALGAPADYTYMGATFTPTDRRLRKEFTALYSLRDRTLIEMVSTP